jgi:protein-S-isoprenylcysteine O-methyltransferase Ste14
LAPGVLLAIVGLGVRAWASSYVKKNQELCTTGPYARTRNPLYFGTFLMGSGIAISTGSLWFVGLFLLLYAAIYVPVMKAEAETLAGLFPSEYGAYSATVPFFLPRLTRRPEAAVHASDAGADWSLYLRHREYRAALGVVLVYALMAAKALILQA